MHQVQENCAYTLKHAQNHRFNTQQGAPIVELHDGYSRFLPAKGKEELSRVDPFSRDGLNENTVGYSSAPNAYTYWAICSGDNNLCHKRRTTYLSI